MSATVMSGASWIAVALEALGVAALVLGVTVTAIAVYGVVRLSGLFPRLQAASKASMLGAVAILAASIGTRDGTLIARAVVVALFLLLTTPVAAHAIASAAYRREQEREDGAEVASAPPPDEPGTSPERQP